MVHSAVASVVPVVVAVKIGDVVMFFLASVLLAAATGTVCANLSTMLLKLQVDRGMCILMHCM